MSLTTKGRYAVTAMLDLALNQAAKPVTLQDIAENQEISLSYLEQLFARLRKSRLRRTKSSRLYRSGRGRGRWPFASRVRQSR